MKLIGFTGKAGAGKDTAAAGLIENGYQKVSFATPIKEALNAMVGWDMSNWSDRAWKEEVDPYLGVSPRHLATTLGTEWGRDTIDQNFWVKLALKRAGDKPTVFTDVRFDNEAKTIKEAGGMIIHVIRTNNPFPVVLHSSENGVSQEYVDFTVFNDESVGKLIMDIDMIVSGL